MPLPSYSMTERAVSPGWHRIEGAPRPVCHREKVACGAHQSRRSGRRVGAPETRVHGDQGSDRRPNRTNAGDGRQPRDRRTDLLTDIVTIDPIHVHFDVDERTFIRLLAQMTGNNGSPVEVEVALTGEDGFPRRGQLDFVSTQADRATGTARLRAILPNPDGKLALAVRPCPRAIVTSQTHDASARSSIGSAQGGRYVLVADPGGIAQFRPVQTGPAHDGGLRIVLKGLEPGEAVVARGMVAQALASPHCQLKTVKVPGFRVMNAIPRFFIDRPIFAIVLSVLMLVAGALALFRLPLSEYPAVTRRRCRSSRSILELRHGNWPKPSPHL